MKWPRIRFSLRMALTLMALFAAALSAWPYLKNRAMDDVAILATNRARQEFIAVRGDGNIREGPREVAMPSTVMPYVVRVVHPDKGEMDLPKGIVAKTWKYYFWCFGLKFRIPIETEISSTS